MTLNNVLTRAQAVAMFGSDMVDQLDALNVQFLTIERGRCIYSASIAFGAEQLLEVRVSVDADQVEAVEDLDDLNWSDIFAKTAIYLNF